MTFNQEDAIYDFLDNMTDPFDLEMILAYIRMIDSKRIGHIADEVADFINKRRLAFNLGNRQWISRHGFFAPIPFVISPTRLELLNGILIPGHRCVPFANPNLLPQDYVFEWKGSQVPNTTTEGDPEEFYPYYSILGEEYAPQYIAKENPENEEAFNSDPYEDPPEVSISTLDMRNIYRETSFVPGDRFIVNTKNWIKGVYTLERAGAGEWEQADLYTWLEAAEAGFEDSFYNLGPGSATEEQIAYAYWYGQKQMRQIPAYSLEEFIYEKTERIETAPYGIETRFWYAGREIPDLKTLDGTQYSTDGTAIEKLLGEKKIPISEFVLQAYIQDFIFRGEIDTSALIERIIPPLIPTEPDEHKMLANYIENELRGLRPVHSQFTNKLIGPIRQRVGELHTAVITLSARLDKEKFDIAWLPKQTYIILSQIQSHAAGIMEELDSGEEFINGELDAIDNSIDSMIETYEDTKEAIEEALINYRKKRFSLVRRNSEKDYEWLIQLGIGGTDVWRRIIIPEQTSLDELHRFIQNVFLWKNSQIYQFSAEKILDGRTSIKELDSSGLTEFLYEYGTKWTVKIILLSKNAATGESPIRCAAGAGASPPEAIGGPLRFKRFISALSAADSQESKRAGWELGQNFKPDAFDLDQCNRNLNSGLAEGTNFKKKRIDNSEN
ncbi:MAG: plasmid pRiA4b ORF-3 family protein [Treponema sp.]|nr:plasmid pRiA4b ORF-3 family protein [Treponema sp.]